MSVCVCVYVCVCYVLCAHVWGGTESYEAYGTGGAAYITRVCVETLFNIEIWTPELDTGTGLVFLCFCAYLLFLIVHAMQSLFLRSKRNVHSAHESQSGCAALAVASERRFL